MSNRRDNQFLWNPHNKATLLDCSFTVASGNANGISGLNASGRIASVYMHTSTTPSAGNPNPASGLIVVNLQDNYNRYLSSYASRAVVTTGSAIASGLTIGQVYVISALGATTLAQWHTAGLAVGIVPAVGVAYIAAATTVAGGGTVKAVAASGISGIELVGNPALANSTGAQIAGAGNGMQLIFACYGLSAAFTGSALGTHTHDLKIIGGQAASTTNDVAAYAGPILGKEAATDVTILGANSATAGGVVAASAGTPAGSVALSYGLVAPADGAIISLNMYLNNSAQGV